MVPLSARQTVAVAALLAVGVLAAAVVPRLALAEGTGSSMRGTLLVATASIGALPAAGTMLAVRMAVRRLDVRSDRLRPGDRVADLLILRRLLQRLLPGFGALVVLATLALGASRSMRVVHAQVRRDGYHRR